MKRYRGGYLVGVIENANGIGDPALGVAWTSFKELAFPQYCLC